jgi:NADH:ubiquinone oxidoreductase subunit 4 (subunit M)
MDFIASNILTIVTFTPALGAVLLLFFNREQTRAIRTLALIITIFTFTFSLHLIVHFDSSNPDFQFAIKVPWIPAYGIDQPVPGFTDDAAHATGRSRVVVNS